MLCHLGPHKHHCGPESHNIKNAFLVLYLHGCASFVWCKVKFRATMSDCGAHPIKCPWLLRLDQGRPLGSVAVTTAKGSLSRHKPAGACPGVTDRLAAAGCRAVYPKGVGGAGLARYLQEANKEVEVWLQVGVTLSDAAAGVLQGTQLHAKIMPHASLRSMHQAIADACGAARVCFCHMAVRWRPRAALRQLMTCCLCPASRAPSWAPLTWA